MIQREFISKPELIKNGKGFQLYHLPTHKEHFYDVHRIEFENEVLMKTNNKCHVCMLVEGESLILETGSKQKVRLNYAETFVIPAATGEYRLTNEGKSKAMVIKAFVKDNQNI